ncbi:MAG TPA: response regulator [bacterium]|nr:response regulator [bacterium]HXC64418.1 response regulator [bacterium]
MSLNVLVVDDSLVMRGMIIKTLRATGLPLGQLLQAANGKEALAALEGFGVDLCLADINMPVMDGEEFITLLRTREENRTLPVVVVSSDLQADRVARLSGRHTAIIHKPFTPEGLRDAVVAMMGMPELAVLEARLRDSAADAMEKLCFILPSGEPREPAPLTRAMQVRFNGRYSGRLVLSVDARLYTALAANMLGEADLGDRQRSDALGEMANVVCGNLLPLLGWNGEFKLGPPEPSSPDCGVGSDACGRYFDLRMVFDEGDLELALCRERAHRAVAA